MILTGPEIQRRVGTGEIEIAPFDSSRINPNSYDFLLGGEILTYINHELDSRKDNPIQRRQIPDSGLVLHPRQVYLGHTCEVIGSDSYVPIIRAKSSIARLGLFIHVTADLIDLGSHGNLTLQFHAVQPVRIYKGMRIGQVTFWEPRGEKRLYEGKYQGSRGPVPSQSYRDFEQRRVSVGPSHA